MNSAASCGMKSPTMKPYKQLQWQCTDSHKPNHQSHSCDLSRRGQMLTWNRRRLVTTRNRFFTPYLCAACKENKSFILCPLFTFKFLALLSLLSTLTQQASLQHNHSDRRQSITLAASERSVSSPHLCSGAASYWLIAPQATMRPCMFICSKAASSVSPPTLSK